MWGCFSVVRLHVVIALCSKSSSISETPSHVAAGHYWPAIPSSQNSLSSSSSSSSSSSLVYHPLRKGSRREMRTPSFISISQAVECCKGIQNFFQNFFTTSSSFLFPRDSACASARDGPRDSARNSARNGNSAIRSENSEGADQYPMSLPC